MKEKPFTSVFREGSNPLRICRGQFSENLKSCCSLLGIDSHSKVPMLNFRTGNHEKKPVAEGTYVSAVLPSLFLRSLGDIQEGKVIYVLGYPVVRKKLFRFTGSQMKDVVKEFFKGEIFKGANGVISKSDIETAEALLETTKGMKIEADIISLDDVEGAIARLGNIRDRSNYSQATFGQDQIIEFLKLSASLIGRGMINKPSWWSSAEKIITAK